MKSYIKSLIIIFAVATSMMACQQSTQKQSAESESTPTEENETVQIETETTQVKFDLIFSNTNDMGSPRRVVETYFVQLEERTVSLTVLDSSWQVYQDNEYPDQTYTSAVYHLTEEDASTLEDLIAALDLDTLESRLVEVSELVCYEGGNEYSFIWNVEDQQSFSFYPCAYEFVEEIFELQDFLRVIEQTIEY